MKKIVSAAEAEKGNKKKVRWFSIIVLLMLAISSIGYSFLSKTDDGSTSSNSNVQTDGNQWVLTINGQRHTFLTSPEATKEVSVNIFNNLASYSGRDVYISSGNEGISYEIASNLDGYASRIQKACYGNCSDDLPERDCNSTMIVWRSSDLNRVYQKDNCVFIEGDMRAADAFLYKIFEIN